MHLHVSTAAGVVALRRAHRLRSVAARPVLACTVGVVLLMGAAAVMATLRISPRVSSSPLWQVPAPVAPIVGSRVLTPALDRARRLSKAGPAAKTRPSAAAPPVATPPPLPPVDAAPPLGPSKPVPDLLDRLIDRLFSSF